METDLNTVLSAWVAEHEANGIKQHSDEWYKAKVHTIGGSSLATIQGINPYGSLPKLVSEKIGYAKFVSDIAPQWGNLFEDVIKRVVEREKNCTILGEDMFVSRGNGISYSPDGLAVITVDGQKHVALMEFKCPFRRIPNGEIPKYYVPQVKMGLEVLEIPTIGLYVEGVFRRCSWTDLGKNMTHDQWLVPKSVGVLPRAYGMIGFYMHAKDIDPSPTWMSDYIDHFGSYGDESNEYATNDLGDAPPKLFMSLMNALDKKIIHVQYGDIVFTSDDDSEHVLKKSSAIIDKYSGFCFKNKYINIGILPWKLFQTEYHYVEKEENYLDPWMQKIQDVLNVVSKCNDPENESIKSNIFSSYVSKTTGHGFI